jgi:hypothetical protein
VDVIGVNWPAYAELNPEVMTESFQTLIQWYLGRRDQAACLCDLSVEAGG